MITQKIHSRKFLDYFTNDDSAITTRNRLEKMAELLISEKSLAEFKKKIDCGETETNIIEIKRAENLKEQAKDKLRSNSSPCVRVKSLVNDVNKLSMQVKEKGSKMKQQLTECLNSDSGVQILKYYQAETKTLLGMTPNSIIADTETTLSNISSLVKGSKRMEDELKRSKYKSHGCEKENIKKVIQASRRVRFILSDLFNNIVILDSCLGRKNFKKLVRDFEKKNRERSPRICILRSSKKNHLDLKIDSDLPKLAMRERQKREELIDEIYRGRLKFLKGSKKM